MFIPYLRGFLPWGVLLALSASANCQDSSPPTGYMEELVSRAMASSAHLAVQQGALDAADAGRTTSAGWPDPSIALSASPAPVYTARGVQRYQLRVEQPLPSPGSLGSRREILAREADVARSAFEARALAVAYEVRSTYIKMAEASWMRQLIVAFQAEIQSFESIAAAHYEVGSGSQQAILSAQLERNRLSLAQERLAGQWEMGYHKLVSLGAVAKGDSVLFTEELAAWYPDAKWVEESAGSVVVTRPEIHQFASQMARENAVVSLERTALWPEIRLQATYLGVAKADIPASADGRDAFTIGAGIMLPLWRARTRSKIELASARRRLVDLQLDAFETDLELQLSTIGTALTSAASRMEILRGQLLPQAEAALEASINAYRSGRAGFLDLLDAQRTRFALRSDEISLLAQLNELGARYVRETGADPALILYNN